MARAVRLVKPHGETGRGRRIFSPARPFVYEGRRGKGHTPHRTAPHRKKILPSRRIFATEHPLQGIETTKKNHTMGTVNFYRKNARSVYAFGISQDIEDYGFAEGYFDDIAYDIEEHAKKRGFTKEGAFPETPSERDFTFSPVTEKECSKVVGEGRCDASVCIGLRNGYYEGYCGDYLINVFDGLTGCTFELEDGDVQELATSIMDERHDGEWFADEADSLMEWLESIVEDCEAVLRECSEEELREAGRFSNGMAVYEKAK